MRTAVFFFVLLFSVQSLQAQAVLPLKERAKVMESIQEERFTTLLPQLMKPTKWTPGF